MALVTKLERLERPPAVTASAGRASEPARAADDRELVRWAQAQDKEAFEELIRRHQHRVFAIGIWLRPLFPVCPNPHHMLHFVLAKFLLAFHLTDMQQCLHDYW